jgi:hypothetical protein
MSDDDDENKLVKVLQWVMDIDPADVIAKVTKKQNAHQGEDARALAQQLVQSYARKAGAEGFVSGLAPSLILMFGTATVDMAYVLRLYAYLTAAIGYLANPNYFDDPDWKDDAFLMLAGPKAVSRLMREAGVQLGRHGSKILIKRYLSRAILTALKKFILKWFGKKVTQRMIITKVMPVVGGVIGGSWNYVELRVMGSRIIGYHFDGTFGE